MTLRSVIPALFALLLVAAIPAAHAQDDAKTRDIRSLLQITQAEKIAMQVATVTAREFLTTMNKSLGASVPPQAYDIANEEIVAHFRDNAPQFLDRIAQIYSESFSHAEIRDLLAFYATPTGRKALRILPSLTQKSMAAGQQWGEALLPSLQQRIAERFRREGLQ